MAVEAPATTSAFLRKGRNSNNGLKGQFEVRWNRRIAFDSLPNALVQPFRIDESSLRETSARVRRSPRQNHTPVPTGGIRVRKAEAPFRGAQGTSN